MIRIYLITNLINGKQYVGKTKHSISYRFSQHCNNNYKTHLHHAIIKYGKENFSIEEICVCDESHWKELETFYIKFYHTHYTEGGYNSTWGGDSNPMEDPVTRIKHQAILNNLTEHKERSRKNIIKYNQSNARKELDKRTSQRQKGVYMPQFKRWNDSHRVPVAIVDESGIELQRFNSCREAIDYLRDVEGIDVEYTSSGTIKRYADKFNKNGKRSKFLGHCWHIL